MTILIAGGTGLIGQRLTHILNSQGHVVHILTRQDRADTAQIKYFKWSIGHSIDKSAFYVKSDEKIIDGIINLTGAGIADKRWNQNRKKELIDSRIKPAEFLQETLKNLKIKVPVYISASGVNYYDNSETKQYVESDSVGTNFVQNLCKLWEEQAFSMTDIAERVLTMRTGVVLAKKKSFLQKFTATTNVFVAGIFGSGNQFLSWIHIDDLCDFFIYALENSSMNGAYNAGICENETHLTFLKSFKKGSNKKFLILKAPKLMARLIFGEMSTLLTDGVMVSNQKMLDSGFEPKFDIIENAVKDLV